MTEPSSYLKYLPPVLWQDEPAAPQFSLGAMLRIFEKILTGIPDGVSAHDAITAQIARMDRLFDPWTAPGDFLPWLASWVALEFPELQGSQLWDEYQRRKVTAEIARIYRQRGTKAGLGTYLSLYAVGSTRPRVALDEGIRLLSVDPAAGGVAAVTGLVSQGPAVLGSTVSVPGMTRPWCVAVSSDGSLLVGDTAVPAGVPIPLTNCVWHLDQVGRYDLAGAPPRPQPVAAGTLPLTSVVALAVRPAQGPAPETLYVLDRPGRLYAIPAPFPASPAVQAASLATPGAALWPVAMAVDPGNGNLLVLDRGPQPPEPAAAQIITIQPAPLTVTRTALHTVTEPLSLVAEPDGTLLIGDGGDQAPATSAGFPGNLVRVRPQDGGLDRDGAAARGQPAGRADGHRPDQRRAALRPRRGGEAVLPVRQPVHLRRRPGRGHLPGRPGRRRTVGGPDHRACAVRLPDWPGGRRGPPRGLRPRSAGGGWPAGLLLPGAAVRVRCGHPLR